MIAFAKEQKTYADYAALEEGAPYQLIDGVFVMSPSPSRAHQDALLRLVLRLERFVTENKLGDVYIAPFDVKLSETEAFQPDALFLSNDRLDRVTEQYVDGAPDLVVEVLSPATGYYDLTHKRHVYETAGVQEYWIVDPMEKTIDVLANVDGVFTSVAQARNEGRVASRLLEGFAVSVEEVLA